MFIDLSILVSSSSGKTAAENEKLTSFGHHGTHFDVMNKEFPQKFIRLAGLVFNVSGISGRDINIQDIDPELVEQGMFVVLNTNFIVEKNYGSKEYFSEQPQLSNQLID
jgi:hypothetical protein